MIIEICFCVTGGINFGLERSWKIVENLMNKYPNATWVKRINKRKRKGKYIIEID